MEFYHKELSYKVIGLAMEVHRKLGGGFVESVYENALMILLEREGIRAAQQFPLKVWFEQRVVGKFEADIVIEDVLLLELKAVETLLPRHRAQIVNYLKATQMRAGYLINFGKKSLEYERFVN